MPPNHILLTVWSANEFKLDGPVSDRYTQVWVDVDWRMADSCSVFRGRKIVCRMLFYIVPPPFPFRPSGAQFNNLKSGRSMLKREQFETIGLAYVPFLARRYEIASEDDPAIRILSLIPSNSVQFRVTRLTCPTVVESWHRMALKRDIMMSQLLTNHFFLVHF